jgi:hypothetical protein
MKDRFAAYKSKRFIIMLLAITTFIVTLYTTKYDPIELATAITMIFGMYIALQSMRPSPPDDNK